MESSAANGSHGGGNRDFRSVSFVSDKGFFIAKGKNGKAVGIGGKGILRLATNDRGSIHGNIPIRIRAFGYVESRLINNKI